MGKVFAWLGVIVAILFIAYLIFFFVILGGPENVKNIRQELTQEGLIARTNVVRFGLELHLSIHNEYPVSLTALDADPLVPEIGRADIQAIGSTATYRVSDDRLNYQLCVDSVDPFSKRCYTATDPLPF